MRFSADNRLPAKMDRTDAFSLYAIFRDISRWINSGFVSVADSASDTTTWPLLAGSQTGDQQPTTDADFSYDAATNTVTFGNITGSALAMTIQPRAPTVLENPGTLTLRGQAATKANTPGGGVTITPGASTGSGAAAVAQLQASNGVAMYVSSAGAGILNTDAQSSAVMSAAGTLTYRIKTGQSVTFVPFSGSGAFEVGATVTGLSLSLQTSTFAGFSLTSTTATFSGPQDQTAGSSNPVQIISTGNTDGTSPGTQIQVPSGNVFAVAESSVGQLELGFYQVADTPVAQPTGVAVTAAGIHAALVTLGLITA